MTRYEDIQQHFQQNVEDFEKFKNSILAKCRTIESELISFLKCPQDMVKVLPSSINEFSFKEDRVDASIHIFLEYKTVKSEIPHSEKKPITTPNITFEEEIIKFNGHNFDYDSRQLIYDEIFKIIFDDRTLLENVS